MDFYKKLKNVSCDGIAGPQEQYLRKLNPKIRETKIRQNRGFAELATILLIVMELFQRLMDILRMPVRPNEPDNRAAYKVEYQPLNRSNSQLTYS